MVKNPNWQEADQSRLFYTHGPGVELGTTENKSSGRMKGLNPGPWITRPAP